MKGTFFFDPCRIEHATVFSSRLAAHTVKMQLREKERGGKKRERGRERKRETERDR